MRHQHTFRLKGFADNRKGAPPAWSFLGVGSAKVSGMTARTCSDILVEPLPGTAKQEKVYVLFEWPGGWSRDVLDGDTFGPELTRLLKEKLAGHAGLQLIRRPGRKGHQVGNMHRCYLVWAQSARMEMLLLTGPEKIVELDLTGPGRNGGGSIDSPLVLVCTHGRRDVCCAVKGRPLAAGLVEDFPELIWESSHTKGHRFAPSVLLMPWGYSFGRLNLEAGRAMVRAAATGEYFYPSNRGRGIYDARGQVAELAIARRLIEAGEKVHYGDLSALDKHVVHVDGREWDVDMEQKEVSGIVSSCGDEPKTSRVWVAV